MHSARELQCCMSSSVTRCSATGGYVGHHQLTGFFLMTQGDAIHNIKTCRRSPQRPPAVCTATVHPKLASPHPSSNELCIPPWTAPIPAIDCLQHRAGVPRNMPIPAAILSEFQGEQLPLRQRHVLVRRKHLAHQQRIRSRPRTDGLVSVFEVTAGKCNQTVIRIRQVETLEVEQVHPHLRQIRAFLSADLLILRRERLKTKILNRAQQ